MHFLVFVLNFVLITYALESSINDINHITTIVQIKDDNYEEKIVDGIIGKTYSIRVDSKGAIYYRDYGNMVYVLKPGTKERTPVETSGLSFDIALDDNDNVYIANNDGINHLVKADHNNELIEGAARSVYYDKHSNYLYCGFLRGGIYRINNCMLNQLKKLYKSSKLSDNPKIISAFKAIITETAEKIKGIPDDCIVKKLAVTSKGDIYYIDNAKPDAFVLEKSSSVPRRIYLGNRFIYDVKIDSDDTVYFAGILGLFVYRSDDSHSWSTTKVNTTIGTVYTVYPAENDIYLGGDEMAYKLEKKFSYNILYNSAH